MRVTAGQFRGRVIQAPDLPGLRPTPSKVRQALFNMLGDISGLTVLDLFAGSGIMALEALSRDAGSAISIEQNGRATEAMQAVRDKIDIDNWKIIKGRLPGALQQLREQPFDLIFADPPYEEGIAEQVPVWLDENRIICEQLVIEESSRSGPVWPENWTLTQSRRYGDTCIHFLEPEKRP